MNPIIGQMLSRIGTTGPWGPKARAAAAAGTVDAGLAGGDALKALRDRMFPRQRQQQPDYIPADPTGAPTPPVWGGRDEPLNPTAVQMAGRQIGTPSPAFTQPPNIPTDMMAPHAVNAQQGFSGVQQPPGMMPMASGPQQPPGPPMDIGPAMGNPMVGAPSGGMGNPMVGAPSSPQQPNPMNIFQRSAFMQRDPDTGEFLDPTLAAQAQTSPFRGLFG